MIFKPKFLPQIITVFIAGLFFFVCGSTTPVFGEKLSNALTLEEAYSVALTNNEDIKVSKQDLEQAMDNVDVTMSALLPSLSISGEARRRKESSASFDQNQENIIGTAQFKQPIYRGGKSWYGLESAQLKARAQKLRHFRLRQEVLLSVARRFFKVLLARREVKLSRNTVNRSSEQLKQAKARYNADQTTKTPVLRAKVQVSEAREQLQRSQNKYDIALQELAVVMGVDEVPDEIKGNLSSKFKLNNPESYVQTAMKQRRDLSQLEFMKQSAREQVKVQKADWFPTLDIEARGQKFDKSIAGEKEDWTVKAVMSYPIFSGWKEQSEISKAVANYKKASEQVNKRRRQVRLQVRESYLNIQTQREVINSLENQVKSARENYRQVSAQFEEGLVNSVDVSDAITVLNQSELRLANARTQYKLDQLRLRLATGVYQQKRLGDQ